MKYRAIKDMSGANLDIIISRISLYFLPTLLGLIIVIIVSRATKWLPKAAGFSRKIYYVVGSNCKSLTFWIVESLSHKLIFIPII